MTFKGRDIMGGQMKSERYYTKYLERYFDKHWGEYDETAGWLVNPAPNTWQFVVIELGLKVTLRCTDNGFVTEKRERI